MKKILVLSLMILAIAATAYSQAPKLEFKASGFFDMRTEMWKFNDNNHMGYYPERGGVVDVTPVVSRPNGGEWNRTASYVEQRGRLKFDAIMGKELSGTIFFEMDSRTWGDDQGQTRNQVGRYGTDAAGLEVKNLYFDVAVPYIPVPITFRAGIQPYGIRSNMFWYNDGAGITVAAKFDPVQVTGYWMKGMEGKIAAADDIDVYGLALSTKVGAVTVGGYGFYFNMRQLPVGVSTNGTAYGLSADSQHAQIWWFGAYADGKLGPVNMNFDFVLDNGKAKHTFQPYPDVKYSGWASRLKIDFPWEMFNFGFVGAYGTGANLRKTSRTGLPNTAVVDPNYAAAGVTSSKVGSYIVPPFSENGSFDESEVFFASFITGGYTGIGYSGGASAPTRGMVGGIWLAKLYGSYKVSPDYKVTLQGLYIGDTAKNGDTFGTSLNTVGSRKNNSTIGWELDLINQWQVYKNLSFKFGGGVLFAGDALKFYDGVKGKNVKPDTPWYLGSNLTYSF